MCVCVGRMHDAAEVSFGIGFGLLTVVFLCGVVCMAGYGREPMVRRSWLFLVFQNAGALLFYFPAIAIFSTQFGYAVWLDMLADVGQSLFLWAVAFRSYRLALVFDVLNTQKHAPQPIHPQAPPHPQHRNISIYNSSLSSSSTATTPFSSSSLPYNSSSDNPRFSQIRNPNPNPNSTPFSNDDGSRDRTNTLGQDSAFLISGYSPPTLTDAALLSSTPPPPQPSPLQPQPRQAPRDDNDDGRSIVSATEELGASIGSPFIVTPQPNAESDPRDDVAHSSMHGSLVHSSMHSSISAPSFYQSLGGVSSLLGDNGGVESVRLNYWALLRRYGVVILLSVLYSWSWNLAQAVHARESLLIDFKIAIVVVSGLAYSIIFGYCIYLLRSVDGKFTACKEMVIMIVISLLSRVAIIWKVVSGTSYAEFNLIPVVILLVSLGLYTLVSSVYPAYLVLADVACFYSETASQSRILPLYDSVNGSTPALFSTRDSERAPLFEARLRHHDVHTVASLSRA